MGLRQVKHDADLFFDRAQTARKQAARELDRSDQYRHDGNEHRAEDERKMAEKLTREADQFEVLAAAKEAEARKTAHEVARKKQEVDALKSQLSAAEKELRDLEGGSRFSLI